MILSEVVSQILSGYLKYKYFKSDEHPHDDVSTLSFESSGVNDNPDMITRPNTYAIPAFGGILCVPAGLIDVQRRFHRTKFVRGWRKSARRADSKPVTAEIVIEKFEGQFDPVRTLSARERKMYLTARMLITVYFLRKYRS